jgi:outer membrane protein assembly factor BamB
MEVGFGTPYLRGDGRLIVQVGTAFGDGTSLYDTGTGAFLDGGPGVHVGAIGITLRGAQTASLSYQFGSGGPVLLMLAYPGGNGFLWFGATFPIPPTGRPILLRNRAYATVGDFLYAFELGRCDPGPMLPSAFCNPVLVADVGGGSPVVAGGNALAFASGDTVNVVNARTGAPRWSARLPTSSSGSPAVAKRRRMFVAGEEGNVYALDGRGCGAPTCDVLWTAQAGVPIAAQIVVAGDVLYAGTTAGNVVAFDADGCGETSCEPLWTSDDLGSAVTGGPVVAGGRVFVGTEGGELIAFRLAKED